MTKLVITTIALSFISFFLTGQTHTTGATKVEAETESEVEVETETEEGKAAASVAASAAAAATSPFSTSIAKTSGSLSIETRSPAEKKNAADDHREGGDNLRTANPSPEAKGFGEAEAEVETEAEAEVNNGVAVAGAGAATSSSGAARSIYVDVVGTLSCILGIFRSVSILSPPHRRKLPRYS